MTDHTFGTKRRRRGLGCVVGLVLFAGLVGAYRWHVGTLRPPAHVESWVDYMLWQGPPGNYFWLTLDGETYVEACGPSRFLGSGSSAYVFDKTGALVDWTIDCGDDRRFQKKWEPQNPVPRERASYEDVGRFFQLRRRR